MQVYIWNKAGEFHSNVEAVSTEDALKFAKKSLKLHAPMVQSVQDYAQLHGFALRVSTQHLQEYSRLHYLPLVNKQEHFARNLSRTRETAESNRG